MSRLAISYAGQGGFMDMKTNFRLSKAFGRIRQVSFLGMRGSIASFFPTNPFYVDRKASLSLERFLGAIALERTGRADRLLKCSILPFTVIGKRKTGDRNQTDTITPS
jgi:hypothetical protein